MTLPGCEPVPVGDTRSALPAGWHHGAFMQIFVRAWRDSNGDGIGDLRGLIDTLPYLQDLGVRGLWLMPVHPSQDGDHGYAVTDYRDIHPDYGTLADFDALIDAAHARGIGVVIDVLINHSAARHPLFMAACSGRDSPVRDWYVWRDAHPTGWRMYDHDPWRREGDASYFAAFSRHMPDFNWRHPGVQAWHHDNLRFWLNRGVDGFRFDAVGHLVENGPDAWDCQPGNYALMAGIRRLLDGYEHRFMVAEAPGDPQGFARAAGSAFAFDLNGDILAAVRGDAPALQRLARYFETAPPGMATLLSNHDSFAGGRVHDQLHGHGGRMRLAAAANLLLPGTPFVYYGEEIGMAGHRSLPADPALRTPMSWTADPRTAGFSQVPPFRALSPNAGTHHVAAQQGVPGSLHGFYRAMLALRNGRPSLARGDYAVAQAEGGVFAFHRRREGEHTLVMLNMNGRAVTARPAGLPTGHRLVPLHAPAGAAGLSLPAHGVAVHSVRAGH